MLSELKREPLVSHMDFSIFSLDYNNSRKGEVGILKTEIRDYVISKRVAMKVKMFSVKVAGKTHGRVKGVPSHFMS